ncbi:MAG: DUF2975 domain-containing protein [Bacteroidota bacterium]
MEKLRSLKIYKILLDIGWYGLIIVMFMYFIVNILSLIAYNEIRVDKFTPFDFSVEVKSFDFAKMKNYYSFKVDDAPILNLKLEKIELSKLSSPFVLWYLFVAVLGFCITLFQLKLFREFISDVIEKKIFTLINVKRLRLIGFMQLLMIPIGIVIYLVFTYFFVNHPILDKSLSYAPNYWELLDELAPGLEYLIFAGVFNFGYQLKQEQDLTI